MQDTILFRRSGHTATVFIGAELVRIEYGGWYGAGAYTIATGVAFMRMYNGRHWLHDVVAGAGGRHIERTGWRMELPVVAKNISKKREGK